MSSLSTSFWSISGLTVVGGVVAYALYFDQKRRSDPTFRRKLRQQKKKVGQWEEEARKRGGGASGLPQEMILAMYEKASQERIPTSLEERHIFFQQAVSLAEQLSSMGPANAAEAALYFFQALRAYPSPSELAAIYQKTLPEKTLAIVMELHALDSSKPSNGPSIDLEDLEPSPISKGPPSETSSQEWDKLTETPL